MLVLQQLTGVIKHELLQNLQIKILQQLTLCELFTCFFDTTGLAGLFLHKFLPRENIDEVKSEFEKAFCRHDFFESIKSVESGEKFLSLTPLIAKDMFFPGQHVALLFDEFPVYFENPFSIEILVSFISFLIVIDGLDGEFSDFISEHSLLDYST